MNDSSIDANILVNENLYWMQSPAAYAFFLISLIEWIEADENVGIAIQYMQPMLVTPGNEWYEQMHNT